MTPDQLTQTPPSGAAGGSHPVTAASLRESLDSLIESNLSREAFAAEAVRLISRASNVKSVVLTTCDMKRSRLFILSSVGIDPKALEILASAAGRWIAMRCLNEHRITVIAPAADNPFVPQGLVSAIDIKTLAIAAIPFYRGSTPVGSCVLFSPTPVAFSDSVLANLSQALRSCAKVLIEPESVPVEPPGKPEALSPPHAVPPDALGQLERPTVPTHPGQPEPRAAAQPPTRPKTLARLGQAKAAGERIPADVPKKPDPPPASAPPARRVASDSDHAFLQRQLEEERKRVMMLEEALAQSRAQAARSAQQQGAAQRLKQQAMDTQAVTQQAREQAAALQSAVQAIGLPATTPTGRIAIDAGALATLARLTDSLTGLLNRAAEDAAPLAAASKASGPQEPHTPAGAQSVLLQVCLDLQSALAQLGRDNMALQALRDRLHTWRINRAEATDAETDKSEADAAQATWLLGDQLDDLIDEFEVLRRRASTLTKSLDERVRHEQGKAPA